MAVAALRFRGLRQVVPAGHGEVLRLLAKRNTDIGNQRTRLVCRIHALVADLAPGGIAKEINASDVDLLAPGLGAADLEYAGQFVSADAQHFLVGCNASRPRPPEDALVPPMGLPQSEPP